MGESDFCKAVQPISIVGIRTNLVPLTRRPELFLFLLHHVDGTSFSSFAPSSFLFSLLIVLRLRPQVTRITSHYEFSPLRSL